MSVQQKTADKELLSISDNSLFFSGDPNILSPKAIEAFSSAKAELNLISERLLEMKAKGEIFYKERYDTGFQDGKEEGSFEHLLKIFGTIFSSINFLGTIEGILTRIVTQAVYKVVGDIGNIENVRERARNGLKKLKDIHRITLRVSPEKEQALLASLTLLKEKDPESFSFISVISDNSVNVGKCVLESELGVVSSSLEIQAKALEQSMAMRK